MHVLLSPTLCKRLNQYRITTNRIVHSGQKGERRSSKLGASLEFSDYRQYSQGDDVRQIDWNSFARSHKYYIKQYLDEKELTVTVFLDCTKSMAITKRKWELAKQIVASIAYLSLSGSDRFGFIPVASSTGIPSHLKGKAMTTKILQVINTVGLGQEQKCFGEQLYHVIGHSYTRSLSIIISDLLDDPSKLFQSIKRMQAKQQQILLLHVFSPEEENPDYEGDLKLVDVETMSEKEVSLHPKILKHYKENYKTHVNMIKSFCSNRGIDFIPCPTSSSVNEIIFSKLLSKGWVRR